MSAGPAPRLERWLTFEVGGSAWALPISDVLEVTEPAHIGRVPTLPREVGGVMHYHGDALPIVARTALFDVEADALPEPEHVVVLADRSGDAPELGLPVDRVLGLVDAESPATREPGLVAAHLPIEGRVTGVLDTRRLVARAAETISGSGRTGFHNPEHEGET